MITGWWCNNHPEDMKVNGKDDIPYMKWKYSKSCLKPPTSCYKWVIIPLSIDISPTSYIMKDGEFHAV
jgi:hypothetical protein